MTVCSVRSGHGLSGEKSRNYARDVTLKKSSCQIYVRLGLLIA